MRGLTDNSKNVSATANPRLKCFFVLRWSMGSGTNLQRQQRNKEKSLLNVRKCGRKLQSLKDEELNKLTSPLYHVHLCVTSLKTATLIKYVLSILSDLLTVQNKSLHTV